MQNGDRNVTLNYFFVVKSFGFGFDNSFLLLKCVYRYKE